MADAFDQFETLLLEKVAPRVHDLVLKGDDPAWRLMDTFEPVVTASRDTASAVQARYEASWRIRIQRAGRVGGGTFTGNTPMMMGANSDLAMGQAADALYLDPANTPSRSWLKIKMYLKRMLLSTVVNRQQILADMAADPIEEIAAGFIEDMVYQVRQLVSAQFWSDGTGLMALANGADTITETTGAIAIDEGTPFRFVVGQRYVAASNADPRVPRAGSLNNPGVFRCTNIDLQARSVFFQSEPGEGTITLTDNDAILAADMTTWNGASTALQSLSPQGIESLVVASGVFPGTSLTVTDYAQLRGWVDGAEGDDRQPTPEAIAKIIDQISDADLEPPGVLISERSVETLYAQSERQGGAEYQVPQGAPFVASGGVTAARASHREKSFAWLNSSKIRPGAIYGIDPSSWKRFMPLGDKTLHWVTTGMNGMGAPAMFRHVITGRTATELMAADGDFFIEFGLTEPWRQFRALGFLSQRTS